MLHKDLEKEFVPHAESYELKEVGFNEPCFGYYDSEGLQRGETFWNRENKNSLFVESEKTNNPKISAPTFSQAFRWFREKYEIAGEVNNYYSDGKWSYNYDIVTKYKEKASDMFDKHEDAELACLRKLIEIVKKKQDVKQTII